MGNPLLVGTGFPSSTGIRQVVRHKTLFFPERAALPAAGQELVLGQFISETLRITRST